MHNDHLSDEAVSLYAEALKLDKLDQLPQAINEHIESCDHCHAQSIELYSIIKDVERSGPHPYFDKAPAKVFPIRTLASIAAVLLIGGLMFFFITKNQAKIDTNPDRPVVEQDSVLEEESLLKDTVKLEEIIPEEKPSRPIAMAYTPNAELEDLVNSVYRSSGLSIEAPENGASFTKNTAIPFSWKGSDEQRFLIILDNKGKQVSRRLLNVNTIAYEESLNSGLFYWKLESEEDLLHVGKFSIKE